MAVVNLVKRLLAALALTVAGIAGLFFWYLNSLPTMPPQQVLAGDPISASGADLRCQPLPLHSAYQVETQVESRAGDQVLYASTLNFRLHLQQEQGDRVLGLVSDIQITEQQQPAQPMADMTFLSRAAGADALVFIAFNDLALMPQHPLSIVGQVIKNLSVGVPGHGYRFAYDALQRTYRYDHQTGGVTRSIPVAQGGLKAGTLQPVWQVTQDGECLPQSMQAEEIQPLTIGTEEGVIRFRMQAQRVDGARDLTGLNFSAQANRHLFWQTVQVNADGQPVAAIGSTEQMWAVFDDFTASKDTARLLSAARYLLENVPVYDLAGQLADPQLNDASRRDLIFALGLVRSAEAEGYLLNLLQALPSDSDAMELQKVRIMVAVAGNGDVSDQAYRALETLAGDASVSANIRNNALINLGTVVQQRAQQGDTANALRDELSATLLQQLQATHTGHGSNGDASAAIFSAGNAGLLEQDAAVLSAVQNKLSAGNAKERYAAATVLSRSAAQYDALIRHMQQEQAVLVNNAILYGLKPAQLSAAQKQNLQTLASHKPELQPLIAKLL